MNDLQICFLIQYVAILLQPFGIPNNYIAKQILRYIGSQTIF